MVLQGGQIRLSKWAKREYQSGPNYSIEVGQFRVAKSIRISELTRTIAEALANGNESFAAELDKEVDLELGRKERGMGALHQRQKEHCC
jgi:hypothetical protein